MVSAKKRRRGEQKEYSPQMRVLFEYAHVFLGAAIVAISFNLFLLPNQIASGGVSGVSTVVYAVTQFEPAFTQWALNIPLFIAGVVLLGGLKYGAKTLVGTLFLPYVVFLTRNWEPATSDPLLAALFGGIGVGLGLGIVFRSNSSTGGTDLAAQVINKYTGVSLGASVFMMDGLVVLSSAIVFNIEFALYALISLYVTGKTIDIVQVGLGRSKMAMIISDQQEQVKKDILEKVDRGVTKLDGHGGYTDDERPVLLCVVNHNEVSRLKQVVKATDPGAFVIVSDTNEVLGEGFKT